MSGDNARGRFVWYDLMTTDPEAAKAFYAAVAKDLGVPYEEGVITEVLKDASLKSDPIHPNARGYRVIAERLAARLKKSGAL